MFAGGAAVTLRPATVDDRELLLRIYASTREEELARVLWEPAAKETFLRLQFDAQDAYYREQMAGCEFLVIQVAGRDAGRLYLDRRATEHRLVDIALLPEARGLGVGTRLLRALMTEAATVGKPLTIHVERLNPALRLYRGLGFAQVEDKGVYLFLEWRAGAPAEAS